MCIPNLELFPFRFPQELSRIAFPIIVLLKDDRTDFAQEERLDLPYWTMIKAICVFGRRIQISGHSDFGIFEKRRCIFHFYLGSQADTASAACPAHPGSLD